MNSIDKVMEEIKQRIYRNENLIKELDRKYIRALSPKELSSGMSYEDYDTIHGSRKEYRVEDYYKEKKRLVKWIELDKQLLTSKAMEINDDEYLNLLENNMQKVEYLRIVKGYTQAEVSRLIGISERQIQRIEKKMKMSC